MTRIRVGLYCEGDIIGGAEKSMLTLAAAYRGSAELVVLSPSPVILDAAARVAPRVRRHKLDVPSTHPIGAILAHRRALAPLDLDVLQITLPNPFAARPAQIAGATLPCHTVAVEQLVFAPQRRRGAWLKRAIAVPLRATVAVGGKTAVDLHQLFGLPSSRIDVVYNGIPAEAPEAVPLEHHPVVGCVARYEDQKGLDRLIRAMVDVPRARLVLVGHGSLRSALEAQAEQLGITDRVEVGPWREDARAMIAAFDVFALASRDEAFPLTIVEAMLARTPIVATDVGSVREAVINDRTGILVPPGDHDALVSALNRLLDDPALANRLTSAAHDLALQRFTAERMAADYDAVWASLTDG